MKTGLAALLLLALGGCDERTTDAERTDARAAATGCYETHPLTEYCESQAALCDTTLDMAIAALCARLSDAGTGAELERVENSCGGTTLVVRADGAVQDYHFTGTDDFIGTTSFADDARPGCEQGTSVTYGAPCDRFSEAQPVACE